jgi:hypothetical protein
VFHSVLYFQVAYASTNIVFVKLQISVNNLIFVGPPAYILKCGMHTSDLYIQLFVLEILYYFAANKVRTELLIEFCNFLDIEHKQMCRFETRQLSLSPAVE